jgi:hypothetical protein
LLLVALLIYNLISIKNQRFSAGVWPLRALRFIRKF